MTRPTARASDNGRIPYASGNRIAAAGTEVDLKFLDCLTFADLGPPRSVWP